MAPVEALVDRAQLLRLTGPEMTALIGGLRVLAVRTYHAGLVTLAYLFRQRVRAGRAVRVLGFAGR